MKKLNILLILVLSILCSLKLIGGAEASTIFASGWENARSATCGSGAITDNYVWTNFSPYDACSYSCYNNSPVISVVSGQKQEGNYSLKLVFPPYSACSTIGTSYTVTKKLPNPASEIYARWYIKWSSYWKWSPDQNHRIMVFGNSPNDNIILNIRGNADGNTGRVQVRVVPADSTFSDRGVAITKDTWHLFEIHIVTGAQGKVEIKVNGTPLNLSYESGTGGTNILNINTGPAINVFRINPSYADYQYLINTGQIMSVWYDSMIVNNGDGWIGGQGTVPDVEPPLISSVTPSLITSDSARIFWTTNEPADSQIEYGPTTSYGLQTNIDTDTVTSHSLSLTGLLPSTTYHYRVKSKDASGNLAVKKDSVLSTPETGVKKIFPIGTSLEGHGMHRYDAQYVNSFLSFFNGLSIMPLWNSQEKVQGQYNWKYTDDAFDFAQAHNLPVHINCVLYYGNIVPDWVKLLPTWQERRAAADRWLTAFFNRYKGKFYAAVIVNEMLDAPVANYTELYGADYQTHFYQLARSLNPEVKLMTNENSTESGGTKTDSYYAMAASLKNAGLLDVIGLQGHFLEDKSTSAISATIDYLSLVGLPIYITEFDLLFPDDTAQLNRYSELLSLFSSKPNIRNITHWGFWAAATYMGPDSAIVRLDFSERPSATWLRTTFAPIWNDYSPPVISSVSANSITDKATTISWKTDEKSDSQVEYGPTNSYGYQNILDTALTKSHTQTISGLLPLTTYHYRVKSQDANGNLRASQDYVFNTIAADLTPPTTPVVTDEGQYTSNTAQLYASWTSSDPETGIAEYQYKITADSTAGTVVRDWTSTGATAYVTAGALSLTSGKIYYFGVKAKNAAGLWSGVGYSDGIKVDTTAPTTPVVTDEGSYTGSLSTLNASWTSSDPESGIAEYQYKIIQDSTTGTVITVWTTTGATPSVAATGLALTHGKTYYIGAKAKNGAGLFSTAGFSDGIITDNPPQLGTLTPSSGASLATQAVNFTATYTDPDGWQDIQNAFLLVNTSTALTNCLYVYYYQNTNLLYLLADDGITWLGGYTPGSKNADGTDLFIGNTYAKINCTKTTVLGQGSTLTINWNVTFKTTFKGTKNTYLKVKDDVNVIVGLTQKGTWTVQ